MLATGRPEAAVALASGATHARKSAVAPQWRVIERVTIGQVLLAGGEPAGAAEALGVAVSAAEELGLPHQIQRAIRVAGSIGDGPTSAVVESGAAALERLRQALVFPDR